MAQVITDESQLLTVNSSFSWWQIALIGGSIGLLYWLLTILVGNYIIDPIFCRSAVNAAACSNSVDLSGNITSILVGVIGLGLLVRLRAMRPLVVVLATAILLWGLASWINGLGWAEIAAWSGLLFGLAYVLFSWISRYNRSAPVLVSIVILLVVARVVFVL